MLIHNSIPITLHDILLRFRDSGQEFKLKSDLLKMISNKNYNVDLASLADNKLMYDFGNEMYFDVTAPGNKSTRDETLSKLLKGRVLIVSGISNTIFSPTDLDALCDRVEILLQEKLAGNNSDKINEKIVAIVDKFLE